MFSVGTSMEEFSCVLVVGKLYLFKRFFIPTFVCVDFLSCWQCHENQFADVGFLAK
jgi:hypothetical protein